MTILGRIVDFNHIFQQLQKINKHSSEGCGIDYMNITREYREGLRCVFSLKCKMCRFETTLSMEAKIATAMDATTAAVTTMYEVGLGQATLDTFLSILRIPLMLVKTYTHCSSKLNDTSQSWLKKQ